MPLWGKNDQPITANSTTTVATTEGAVLGAHRLVKSGGENPELRVDGANAHFGNTSPGSRASIDVALYSNTTPGSFIPGIATGIFGIDTYETNDSNGAVTHAGWVLRTEGTGGRAGRVQYETLVAMSTLDKKPRLNVVGTLSGTDNSIEISAIAGGIRQAGDICIIFNCAGGDSVPAAVYPFGAGNVLQENSDGHIGSAIISAKILDGTETTVTGMTAAKMSWVAILIRPNGVVTDFTWLSGEGQVANTNPSPQSIDASGETNLPIIMVGQMAAANTVTPSVSGSFTSNPVGNNFIAHYLVYGANETPTNQPYSMTGTGESRMLQSGYLTFEFSSITGQ